MEELSKILLTDDMNEQNMTDKIIEKLKEMGYDFYHPAYKQGCAIDIGVARKEITKKWVYREKPKWLKINGKEFHAFPAEKREKEGTVYLFEVKRKGISNHVVSTLIMQGIGQLLKYYSELDDKLVGIEIKAFLIYCGIVSEKDKDSVERSIKRFNLPVELIIIPVPVDFTLTPIKE